MDTDKGNHYKLEDGTVILTKGRFVSGKFPSILLTQATKHSVWSDLDVPAVPLTLPEDYQVFDEAGNPQVEFIKSHFYVEGKLSQAQLLKILEDGVNLLTKEPNLLELEVPITICGDIHGQFYDLLKLFEVADGEPPENKFLFLGDYVDRGYFSLECFVYLLAMKLRYPEHVFLLRGNHECRHLTKHFTFKLECVYKYGEQAYDACMKAFDALPLAAVVNKQFFCVHGGLSPELKSPKALLKIDRFKETPKSGIMCDLMWSDPSEDFGNEVHKEHFISNRARGCSYRFTYLATCDFLAKNDLLSVIRGHEAQDIGHKLYRQAEKSEFPALITLFSAPNYVDVYKNKGAIMKYDGSMMNIRQFNAAPHPFYLPKFMNVFDWSLPFVGEKIADLLMAVLDVPTLSHRLETMSEGERAKLDREKRIKMDIIRAKIRAVGRMSKMFATVRDERETLAEFMNATGKNIVPAKYLTLGSEELRRAIKGFSDARKCDKVNEMIPEIGDESDAASVISLGLLDEPQDGGEMEIKQEGNLERAKITTPPPTTQNQPDETSERGI